MVVLWDVGVIVESQPLTIPNPCEGRLRPSVALGWPTSLRAPECNICWPHPGKGAMAIEDCSNQAAQGRVLQPIMNDGGSVSELGVGVGLELGRVGPTTEVEATLA